LKKPTPAKPCPRPSPPNAALRAINSDVQVEGVVADLTPENWHHS